MKLFQEKAAAKAFAAKATMQSELQYDEALATGGPAKAQARVIFVSDTLAISPCSLASTSDSNQAGVIAAVGDLLEGSLRKKVLVIWALRELSARYDGRLHIQDASHLMVIDSEDMFSSIAVFVCPTLTTGEQEEAEFNELEVVDHVTLVVVAYSHTQLHRWTLRLNMTEAQSDELASVRHMPANIADVGKYLQKRRPWRTIPSPLILTSTCISLPSSHSPTFESFCIIGDCNISTTSTSNSKTNTLTNEEYWDEALVLCATAEGHKCIVRDKLLSHICELRVPSDFQRSTGPDRKHGIPTNTVLSNSAICNKIMAFVAFDTGTLLSWDIAPCVHVSSSDLENPYFDINTLDPVLLFAINVPYEIATLLILPAPHVEESNSLNMLLGGRDGRLRLWHAEFDTSRIDAPRAEHGESSLFADAVIATERCCIDLARETRYMDPASHTTVSTAGEQGPTSVEVRHTVSSIPLALAHASPQSIKLMCSGTGAGSASNVGACVLVTAQAILAFSLPELTVCAKIPLIAEGAAGIRAKAISAAALSSYVCVYTSAFDKQVHIHFLDPTAGAQMAKRTVVRRSGIARRAAPTQKASIINKTADTSNIPNTIIEECPARDTLSFFLTANDLTIIRGAAEEDGVELSRDAISCSAPVAHFVSPLATPIAVPPLTPMALRGASSKSSSPSKLKSSWETPTKDRRSGKVVNQPVTFHSRIKSSGYGQTPNSALGVLEKNRKDRLQAAIKARQVQAVRSSTAPSPGSGSTDGNPAPRLRRYPTDGPAISIYQAHSDFTAASKAGPLHRVCFSGDGAMLGLATSDSTVSTLKCPISRYSGNGSFYMSHNSEVTHVQFSHQRGDQQLVLSSSTDGTARIWHAGKTDYSAVCFTHDKCSTGASHISTASAAAMSTSRNRPFVGAVLDASFYYNDRFVTLANGNRALMFTYNCDGADARNDLKRLQSNGTYRRACMWEFEAAKAVTALACINTVLSPLLLCATSDRRLLVLDAARGSVARTIGTPHERAVHCIALPQPSVYAQLDSSAYNVFATAAMDSSILIWDLRAPTVASRFTGHSNRREHVRCALSPCLRYLACGSEDRSARLVDLRTTTEVTRFTGHRDVVSDVAFHPISPQLATASYDGSIKFYCASDL